MYEEILKTQTAHREAVLGAALDMDLGTRILEYETAKADNEFSSDEDMRAVKNADVPLDNRDESAADELEYAARYNTEAAEDYPESDYMPYHDTAGYTMIFDPDTDKDVTGASQT